MPYKNEVDGIFGIFYFVFVAYFVWAVFLLLLSYRSFASIFWLPVLLFDRISVRANMCVPASVCVSCACFISFLRGGGSLCFWSFVCFVLLKVVCFYLSVLRSLSNEKEQEKNVNLVRWERSGRSWGGTITRIYCIKKSTFNKRWFNKEEEEDKNEEEEIIVADSARNVPP